jgi:hypothetical protein
MRAGRRVHAKEAMSSSKSVKLSQLGHIRAGDRWMDADGRAYVVSWVGRMGVVAFRRADERGGGPESVMDVVRFVSHFVPQVTGRAA